MAMAVAGTASLSTTAEVGEYATTDVIVGACAAARVDGPSSFLLRLGEGEVPASAALRIGEPPSIPLLPRGGTAERGVATPPPASSCAGRVAAIAVAAAVRDCAAAVCGGSRSCSDGSVVIAVIHPRSVIAGVAIPLRLSTVAGDEETEEEAASGLASLFG